MHERPDALEDALTELRFRCVPMSFEEAPRPWRREFPVNAISLHVPLEGRYHIDVDTPIWLHRLERGEVLLVNRGVHGALRAATEADPPPEVFSVRIELEAPHGHPLLDAMPQLVQASPTSAAAPSFGPLLEALIAEFRLPVLGRGVLAVRLCEGLFIEALRSHLLDISWTDTGWFRLLADPVLKAQLGMPETGEVEAVTGLAAAANRSTRRFGARFRQFAGFTPSDHLRHTRARRAARQLREGETDLTRIAHLTGYRNRPSFCRAFRRELGVSPAAYWRSVHGRRFPRSAEEPEKPAWKADLEYGCPARAAADSGRPSHPTETE